jgi:hypothetical protein
MNDPNDTPRRGFHWLSRAWYAGVVRRHDDFLDEVMFGLYTPALYTPAGGTTGELAMRWHRQGDRVVARLECYYDAFGALAGFGDVLGALAAAGNVTPEAFCQMLLRLGFEDMTARTRGA